MCCVFIYEIIHNTYLLVRVTVVTSLSVAKIGYRTKLIEGRGAKGMEL